LACLSVKVSEPDAFGPDGSNYIPNHAWLSDGRAETGHPD
jgi:hypothetical protein